MAWCNGPMLMMAARAHISEMRGQRVRGVRAVSVVEGSQTDQYHITINN